ncbi:MAG: amidohydrolase family protein [Acidobacteria bacterium]|nr:amidohydrolase family protein [Acidobacteriota bacterium]
MTQCRKGFCIAVSVVLFSFFILMRAQGAGLEADWVFFNGKILTADSEDPAQFTIAQAVAIYDGKFVAVGSDQEALALAGNSTRRIDLQGKTVIPGMIETHLHVNTQTVGHHMGGRGLGETDPAVRWNNKQEILAQLREYVSKKKPGDWIFAGARELPEGTMNLRTAPSTPSLAELDQAVPNNPLVIGGGYYPTVVNSKTLAIIYENYPEGLAGIVKGPDGKPTGILEWAAAMTVTELTPVPTAQELKDSAPAFRAELLEPAARGLTAVATRVDWDSLKVYQLLDQWEQMPIRLAYAPEMAAYTPRSDFLFRRVAIGPGHGSPWLFMSGATTGTAEYGGSPNAAASCVHGKYDPASDLFPAWEYQPWGDHGECRFRDDPENAQVLKDFFLNAIKNNWVISNLHVNGDRTMDDYLDVLEEAERRFGVKVADYRFSSDHCGWLSEQQAKRAQHLGITFTCTPAQFGGNAEKGGMGAYAKMYDIEQAADAYAPFRRLVSKDMKPSAHCEGHQAWTFSCLEMMITRKDNTGKVYGPQQRINRREALYTFTRWAAWHVWKEKYVGSIEPGKWADLVIIDKDYMAVPEDEISEINPLLTVAGGKIAYSEPKFASSVGLPTVGFEAPPDWWQR